MFLGLGFLLTFLLSSCATLTDFDTGQDYRGQVAVTAASGQVVSQTFVSRRARLNGLQLWLQAGSAPLPPDSKLVVELYRASNGAIPPGSVPLVRLPYSLKSATAAFPVTFSFPPQDDPPGQAYTVVLRPTGGPLKVYGRQEEAYSGGQLFLDGLPLDADLAFRLTYDYDTVSALADLRAMLAQAGLVFPLAAALWLPGRLLLIALGLRRRADWGERTALSLGLSLAVLPLLMMWTTTLGLRWSAGGVRFSLTLLSLFYLAWLARRWLVSYRWGKRAGHGSRRIDTDYSSDPHESASIRVTSASFSRGLFPSLALLIIFLFTLAVRFAMARDLAAPAWVDSVHHATLVRLIAEQGAFPRSYAPYIDTPTAGYHTGFHAVAAVVLWLTRLDEASTLLVLGQVLNALSVLAVYLFTRTLVRSRWAGVAAALVAGLLTPMPAYYTSWGRYTQLAGLLILPTAFAFLRSLVPTLRAGSASPPLRGQSHPGRLTTEPAARETAGRPGDRPGESSHAGAWEPGRPGRPGRPLVPTLRVGTASPPLRGQSPPDRPNNEPVATESSERPGDRPGESSHAGAWEPGRPGLVPSSSPSWGRGRVWVRVFAAALASGGLFLVHYRVAAFLGALLLAFLAVEAVSQALASRRARKPSFSPAPLLLWVKGAGVSVLAAALLAVLLTLPWWPPTLRTLFLPTLAASRVPVPAFSDFSWGFLTAASGKLAMQIAALGLVWGVLLRRRFPWVLALWVALLFLLANPGALNLPGVGFINNLSVEISLFMPTAAAGGFLAGWLLEGGFRLLSRPPRLRFPLWKRPPAGPDLLPPASSAAPDLNPQSPASRRLEPLYALILGVGAAVAGLAGARSLLPVLNPATVLFRSTDRPALAWIAAHVPASETVLINPFLWSDDLYAGNDGGYWITPLAGRRTLPPPVLYGLGDNPRSAATGAGQISAAVRQALSYQDDPLALADFLRARGIHYVYLGARGGAFSPEKLRYSPAFELVYATPETWVFRLAP